MNKLSPITVYVPVSGETETYKTDVCRWYPNSGYQFETKVNEVRDQIVFSKTELISLIKNTIQYGANKYHSADFEVAKSEFIDSLFNS